MPSLSGFVFVLQRGTTSLQTLATGRIEEFFREYALLLFSMTMSHDYAHAS
jgi:hypothetical protein